MGEGDTGTAPGRGQGGKNMMAGCGEAENRPVSGGIRNQDRHQGKRGGGIRKTCRGFYNRLWSQVLRGENIFDRQIARG